MKGSIIIITLFLICTKANAQIEVMHIGTLPEAVTNNAVCEGFISDTAFVFSFGGIDETKLYSGIHNRCFRFNLESGLAESIPNLPDERGKIASWASRIDNIIYIAGGYYVNEDESEESSRKIHRYDIVNNVFLEDGADIPRPIDDHVQAVWRDSLIYLVTGWSNNGNTVNVQIYDPSQDIWMNGTSVPNTNEYKSFGASGAILGDTIYYFGGAASIGSFNVQSSIRRGVINPSDPTQIEWTLLEIEENKVGYRMAAVVSDQKPYWIGGSEVTYNFDGIAYNGSGGVASSNRILRLEPETQEWKEYFFDELPMDLRGIANVSDGFKYIAGGMTSNQEVTDKIYKIDFDAEVSFVSQNKFESQLEVFPNPCHDYIYLEYEGNDDTSVNIYSLSGALLLSNLDAQENINLENFAPGMYLITVLNQDKIINSLFTKL